MREARHGVSYQGAYPQRALIGAGGGALQRGSVTRVYAQLARAVSRRAAPVLSLWLNQGTRGTAGRTHQITVPAPVTDKAPWLGTGRQPRGSQATTLGALPLLVLGIF